MNEEEQILFDLAAVLMANERKEAEAVEGYNEQLKLISRAKELFVADEIKGFLDALEVATKEKISDELNHGESLYAEYVEMTGIAPAED